MFMGGPGGRRRPRARSGPVETRSEDRFSSSRLNSAGPVPECAKQNTRRLVLATTLSSMSTHNTRRRKVRPIVAAVVQPVAKRLSRIEALLIEMRFEQDVQLRRVGALQAQLDTLRELVSQGANHRGASHRVERSRAPVNGGRPVDLRLS